MESIEVGGESISPDEKTEEAWWFTSYHRRGARAPVQLGIAPAHSSKQ